MNIQLEVIKYGAFVLIKSTFFITSTSTTLYTVQTYSLNGSEPVKFRPKFLFLKPTQIINTWQKMTRCFTINSHPYTQMKADSNYSSAIRNKLMVSWLWTVWHGFREQTGSLSSDGQYSLMPKPLVPQYNIIKDFKNVNQENSKVMNRRKKISG